MKLRIISTTSIVFDGEVTAVRLPGAKGSFAVLNNHAPLLSVLDKGTLTYDSHEGVRQQVAIEGGIADVADNVVSVCIF